jgi:hypothetical protein
VTVTVVVALTMEVTMEMIVVVTIGLQFYLKVVRWGKERGL